MKIIECPRCNGNIRLEKDAVDQEIYRCDYCGARVRYRIKSNDAVLARTRVKELEHEEAMAERFYDHELSVMDKTYEQEVDRNKKRAKFTAKYAIICFVAAAVLLGLLFVMDFFEKNPGFLGGINQVQVSKSASQMRGTNHEIIESELRNLGFSDIESEGLRDKGGWLDFTKDGAIDYISINGDSDFKENTWFDKNAKIIIRYHSYPD